MWIFLGIVIFLALLIVFFLSLPVYLIMKTDNEGKIKILFKFLHKTFGQAQNSNSSILKTLKKATGTENAEEKSKKITSFVDLLDLIIDILKELLSLVKYCTAKKFKLKIVCADEDAATAAIKYGACCAAVYPLTGFLHSAMKIKKSGEDITVDCIYQNGKNEFLVEIILHISVFRILIAALKVLYREVKRRIQK